MSKTQEKSPQGRVLDFSLLGNLKTIFWMENLTQRWTQSPKSKQFFWFSKKGRGGLTPHPPAPPTSQLLVCHWKERLAWHSVEVRDALVAVPKSDWEKDTTQLTVGFFSKFLKNKRDLPKVEIRFQAMRN